MFSLKTRGPIVKNSELCVAHRAMCIVLLLLYALFHNEACTSLSEKASETASKSRMCPRILSELHCV